MQGNSPGRSSKNGEISFGQIIRKRELNESPTIGIDLGTTCCCVGYLNSDNQVEIFENFDGSRTTPSYITFSDDEEIIGASAKDTLFRSPYHVIYDTKRLIGRRFDDEYVQHNLKQWGFQIVPDINGAPLIRVNENRSYDPKEISAIILKYLKRVAEENLETTVQNAVITVPAYFNYNQRTSTREAGILAGLKVMKIMNEPTAAALAYIHKRKVQNCDNILVFDLGGGTLDVSILSVYRKTIAIKATSGNTYLGGRDFDNNLANYVVEEIKKQYGINVRGKDIAMSRILEQSEKVKISLSTKHQAFLGFSNLFGGQDAQVTVTRKVFEELNAYLFERCITIVKNCLYDAKLQKKDIEKIILVGGSTRIPKLQEMLKEFFGDKELCKAINPDEAVAYGAAIQASWFNSNKSAKTEINQHHILEVAPLSIGTDILGDRMYMLVHRNTPIPLTKTETFTTVKDNQSTMSFNIYEGERKLVKYNTKLGTVTIKVPPEPPGHPVDIILSIDNDGILKIGTKTRTGAYACLAIDYEVHDAGKTENAVEEAAGHRYEDDLEYDLMTQWSNIKEYCAKVETICNHNRRGMNRKEIDQLRSVAIEAAEGLEEYKGAASTNEEIGRVTAKLKAIKAACEPLLKKYGYQIENMNLSHFNDLMKD